MAIAVKTDLMPQRRADLETNCECTVVQIGVGSCLVGCMYRTPNNNICILKVIRYITLMFQTGLPYFICRDFNLSCLKWSFDTDAAAVMVEFNGRYVS